MEAEMYFLNNLCEKHLIATYLLITRSEESWVLGVASISVAIYFLLVKIWKLLQKHEIVKCKNKKHLRGSTQATIAALAIILTAVLWILIKIA